MAWTADISALISAVAAVVAACCAGASYRLYRRELQRQDAPPIARIEGTAEWLAARHRFRFVIKVRNRCDFAIAIQKIAIAKPRGTTVGWDDDRRKDDGEISTWKYIDLDRGLDAAGNTTTVVGRRIETDLAVIRIHGKPPAAWVSGTVVMAVQIRECVGARRIHHLEVHCDLPPKPPVP